ncbi:hypothetical protein EDEG_00790 [Edhazardia aedis USNM 41457]|uniref:Uncharacterized protein n=1 Tax=Edhazardia aedis (strain USNM 41457) TaxID=1003232 RepID=J9DRD4_EDHAE|nr:hypothetical protein EDEG_00790 [Edhazardia aedis USNM 41457]|eukprot:EJW05120.1 hypothetical protein EDEG_00790 [Edhazardia aedis USNM 41457]
MVLKDGNKSSWLQKNRTKSNENFSYSHNGQKSSSLEKNCTEKKVIASLKQQIKEKYNQKNDFFVCKKTDLIENNESTSLALREEILFKINRAKKDLTSLTCLNKKQVESNINTVNFENEPAMVNQDMDKELHRLEKDKKKSNKICEEVKDINNSLAESKINEKAGITDTVNSKELIHDGKNTTEDNFSEKINYNKINNNIRKHSKMETHNNESHIIFDKCIRKESISESIKRNDLMDQNITNFNDSDRRDNSSNLNNSIRDKTITDERYQVKLNNNNKILASEQRKNKKLNKSISENEIHVGKNKQQNENCRLSRRESCIVTSSSSPTQNNCVVDCEKSQKHQESSKLLNEDDKLKILNMDTKYKVKFINKNDEFDNKENLNNDKISSIAFLKDQDVLLSGFTLKEKQHITNDEKENYKENKYKQIFKKEENPKTLYNEISEKSSNQENENMNRKKNDFFF